MTGPDGMLICSDRSGSSAIPGSFGGEACRRCTDRAVSWSSSPISQRGDPTRTRVTRTRTSHAENCRSSRARLSRGNLPCGRSRLQQHELVQHQFVGRLLRHEQMLPALLRHLLLQQQGPHPLRPVHAVVLWDRLFGRRLHVHGRLQRSRQSVERHRLAVRARGRGPGITCEQRRVRGTDVRRRPPSR